MNPKFWKLYLLITANVLLIGGWLVWRLVAQGSSERAIAKIQQYGEDLYQTMPPRDPNAFALDIKAFIERGYNAPIDSSVSSYFDDLMTSPDDHIPPIPEAIKEYLDEQAEALMEFRDRLHQGEMPDIGVDYDVRTVDLSTPVPSFINRRVLSRLIMLKAIHQHQTGEVEDRSASLNAAFQLTNSLRDRPELMSQSVALGIENDLLTLMRKLPDFPTPLQEQFQRSCLPRESKMLNALRFESYVSTSMWTDSRLLWEMTPTERISLQVLTPYLSQIKAEQWDDWGQVQDLDTEDFFCNSNMEDIVTQISPGRWNLVDHSGIVEYQLGWLARSQRIKLALELTQKVHQVKGLARQLGEFPESVKGIKDSFCEGVEWTYEVNSDGTATIYLERVPKALEEFGFSGDELIHTISPQEV
ncbi:MAG: hypothetical protein EA395_05785 [Phormidium sp. GEM2.Bin31]|nr:MAG: hypothetical protein EA395_05785 [Phormidium sp. GEM2.Bin31]